MRIGHHQCVGAQRSDLLADAAELGCRRLAGKTQMMQHDRAERRLRAAGPDRIDRIGVGRDQFAAGIGAGAHQPLRAFRRVQPRVVAEVRACGQVGFEPFVGRLVADVDGLERRGVDLVLGLERVAAVDEQDGLAGEHDRNARRPGEAGEPRKPLFGQRNVFVLMAVGARQDEAGKAAARQFGAQRLQARPGGRGLRVVEGLKSRLEHRRQSMGRGGEGQLRGAGPSRVPSVGVRCKK